MFAEIISIGSELLSPDRVDTNSLWITAQLNRYGIEVRRKVIWGDETEALAAEIAVALQRSQIVLTTGGLGPTEDDVTRDAVAVALQAPLESHPDLVVELETKFARFGRTMSPNNLKQCLVPKGATVLPNPMGTAPGIKARFGSSVLFVMPGPPREMKPMFSHHVEPELSSIAGQRKVIRHTLKVIGLGESVLDERIKPIYKAIENPKVGILFSALDVEVHLTAAASSEDEATRLNEGLAVQLRAALGHHVYSETGLSLAQVVGGQLIDKGATLAVIDTATGGVVSQRLSEVAGFEQFMKLGLILPGFDQALEWFPQASDTCALPGAPAAVALARAVQQRMQTTQGLAVICETGFHFDAPQDKARYQKYWIGWVDGDLESSADLIFPGDVELRRSRAAQAALDLIRRTLST